MNDGMTMKIFSSRASLAVLGLLGVLGCSNEPLDVAETVDLDRFQGSWHEIAHMPRIAQSNCTGTTATYTRDGQDRFTFVHECTLASGAYQGSTAAAKVRDLKVPAKLELDFGGHVGDYWILELAPDYRYAVVGHPSRDYLWILSRTPTMAGSDLDQVLAHAREKSFDTDRLEFTAPGPLPSGTPAPQMTHGCSMSAAAHGPKDGLALLFAGIACAAILRVRRRGGRLA